MPLCVCPLTAAHAESICSWRYPKPCDVYDLPPWPEAVSRRFGITRADVREREFFALCSGESLTGFFRLKPMDGWIMMAIGLAPTACGQGLGREAVSLALSESDKRYPSLPVRLEVRAFNRRAIRCYEQAGFRFAGRRSTASSSGSIDFILMER